MVRNMLKVRTENLKLKNINTLNVTKKVIKKVPVTNKEAVSTHITRELCHLVYSLKTSLKKVNGTFSLK